MSVTHMYSFALIGGLWKLVWYTQSL